MPKRKREGVNVLQDALPLALRNLVRNLKVARGIERQKLGRRQKDALARKDAPDNARIEAEIQALKVGPSVCLTVVSESDKCARS